VGGQRHAPAALPLGKSRYPLYRRLGGPQGRSGRVLKISPPPGFDPQTVQQVASRYTDCAIADFVINLRELCLYGVIKSWNPVHTSRKTSCVCIMNTECLMLGELVTVCCANGTKHTDRQTDRQHYMGKMLRLWILRHMVRIVTTVVWRIKQRSAATSEFCSKPLFIPNSVIYICTNVVCCSMCVYNIITPSHFRSWFM
jgi:hypothetical protein